MNDLSASLAKGMKNSKHFFKKHGSLILSLAAGASTIYAVVSAVQATPKALEKIEEENAQSKPEIVQTAWIYYIPTAAAVGISLTCIFGAHILNQKQQKALVGAYLLLEQSYKDYRKKAAELYGDEDDNNIKTEVAKEKFTADEVLKTENGGDELFYDDYSGRYFNSTVENVILAEYHFNRNFVLCGSTSLNEFYKFLGIPEINGGELLGWDIYEGESFYGYSWIDFDHTFSVTEDGLECYIISFSFPPHLSEYLL